MKRGWHNRLGVFTFDHQGLGQVHADHQHIGTIRPLDCGEIPHQSTEQRLRACPVPQPELREGEALPEGQARGRVETGQSVGRL